MKKPLTMSLLLLALAGCAPAPAPEAASNVPAVKGMYESFARGDASGVLGALDPAVRWMEAEGFIYADGNPYIGPEAVGNGVFQRIATDLEDFTVNPEVFIDGGATVVVEGRYRGRVKATGKPVDTQYAHVFEFRDGKVIRFQQYTDTKQWTEAVQP